MGANTRLSQSQIPVINDNEETQKHDVEEIA
jgi:hypothetical protein